MFLANALADLEVPIAYLPVVRLDDEPEVLAEVAAASEMHEQGACLRLGSDENDPDEELAEVQTPEVLAAIGLAAEDVDLVIDMWTVDSTRSVQRAVPVVVGMLEWAAESGPWRSVTVLSGAFPASISDLPTNAATPLRRYDAELFNAVVAEDPPLNPDFGDYAVNHPALPSSAARGPLPNLRYTHETNWQIYRQARAGEPGNEAFFTLCNRVVHSVHWPVVGAAYSWGDHEIQRCSNRLGGAGRATEWRAYGTSHHLVHVVDRLATLGSP